MRTIILTGLIALVVALAPRASQADHAPTIFADFPELSEWGHMVVVGGVEYWRPYPDLVPVGWAPYTDGYLYEDPAEGLVWVSNDPWGVITEHYGYWRHHDRYGYVWRPLYPLEWRPVMNSMFRDDRNVVVGWSPFYVEVWNRGLYVVGWGFDDYYWAPFWNRVCYPDFYTYHCSRFYGWHVGVTVYDYDVYYRDEPDRCYRRDHEYRERRGHHRRERHDSDLRSLVVRDDLKSRQRAEAPSRVLETPTPVRSRGTVSMTPRSVNPWAAPAAEKKNDAPVDRVRAGFQSNPASVVADGRPSQAASTRNASVGRSTPAERTPMATVEPEQRAQRRESGSLNRQIESKRSELQVRREQRVAAQAETPRAESRPARIMERPAARREAQEAPAAPRVERQSAPARVERPAASAAPRVERQAAPAVARFERPAAPAAPRVEKQAAPAERVRGSFNAARKDRN